MSLGGGGGGSTTTVQKADPWPGLQPGLTTLYGGAVNNYNAGGPQYYPGNTLAPSNGTINQALDMGTSRAMAGPYDLLDPAKASLNATVAGRPQTANPAFNYLNAFGNGSVVGSNPAQQGLQAYSGGSYVGSNPAQAGTGQLASQGGTFGQFGAGNYLGTNPAQGGTAQLAGPGGTFGQFASGSRAGTNPAQSYFQNSTNGNYLDQQNPYLSSLVDSASRPVVQNFQNAIAPSLASQFSLAGRSGSGAHNAAFGTAADTLGRNLGDISTSIYGTAYENERQRQQAAAGQLSNMGQFDQTQQMQGAQSQLGALGQLSNMNQAERAQQLAGASGQLGALSQLSGMSQFDRAQQMQGLNSVAGLYSDERNQQLRGVEDITNQYGQERQLQQGAALASPSFMQGSQALDFDRISKLLGVGQFRQGQAQDQINADRERYDFGQNRQNLNLQQLSQLLQGGMALNGSTTSGQQNTQRNPFAGALGGAATGASIGSVFPGLGTGIGAIAGGLGGLLFG